MFDIAFHETQTVEKVTTIPALPLLVPRTCKAELVEEDRAVRKIRATRTALLALTDAALRSTAFAMSSPILETF